MAVGDPAVAADVAEVSSRGDAGALTLVMLAFKFTGDAAETPEAAVAFTNVYISAWSVPSITRSKAKRLMRCCVHEELLGERPLPPWLVPKPPVIGMAPMPARSAAPFGARTSRCLSSDFQREIVSDVIAVVEVAPAPTTGLIRRITVSGRACAGAAVATAAAAAALEPDGDAPAAAVDTLPAFGLDERI
jgi:hypothetical protein